MGRNDKKKELDPEQKRRLAAREDSEKARLRGIELKDKLENGVAKPAPEPEPTPEPTPETPPVPVTPPAPQQS